MTTTMTKELRAPLTAHIPLPDCRPQDMFLSCCKDGRWKIKCHLKFDPWSRVLGVAGGHHAAVDMMKELETRIAVARNLGA